MHRFLLFLLLLPAVACADFKPGVKGKKLISYGQDAPNPAYLRAHVADMEKLPFDGVVIAVTSQRQPLLGNGDTLGCKAWGKTAYNPADYAHAIEDLKATKFDKFADNFIQVEAMPTDVDWFDPEFESVITNFRTLVRIAKEGGCVGLEFDPEEYNDIHIFTPTRWPKEKLGKHSPEQYAQQAMLRGEQLMRALNQEFPGIKILCLFGPTLAANSARVQKDDYTLLAAMIEGMCRAADSKSQIIDGYEQSYGYRTPIAFESARQAILQSREIFADTDKDAFDRVMRVGFGLWSDYNSGKRGWFPDEPQKNHFQPETWQNAVHSALAQSDEYVWIWRERMHLWEGKAVGQAYVDAQRAARAGLAKVTITRREPPEVVRKALAEPGPRDVQAIFGDLLKTHSLLLDLSTHGWMFRTDDQQDWSPIEVAKFWEEQGWDYDGVAWYRRTFKIDAPPAGKVQIVFGACDESAIIYLNDEKLGNHDLGEMGWDQRFAIDITGELRAGDNELRVRVLDRTGPGGLWKPVAIFAEKDAQR